MARALTINDHAPARAPCGWRRLAAALAAAAVVAGFPAAAAAVIAVVAAATVATVGIAATVVVAATSTSHALNPIFNGVRFVRTPFFCAYLFSIAPRTIGLWRSSRAPSCGRAGSLSWE